MATLYPYLRFDGNCREAMEFYKSILGGETTFQTIRESPMKDQVSEDSQSKIMHASLKSDKIELYGADMMRDERKVGDSVVLCFNADNEDQISEVFKKLSEGGEVFMPLEKQFWGALFGVVTDKYGFEWMLNCDLPKA
jgi:PhnB protein